MNHSIRRDAGGRQLFSNLPTGIMVVAASMLFLSGCLLNRVIETRNQFCEYERNFELNPGQRTEFVFKNPVFLPEDIKALTGHEPSYIDQSGGRQHWRYFVEKWRVNPDLRVTYPVDLFFKEVGGEQKLERVAMPGMIGAFMAPDVVVPVASEICGLDWKQMSRTLDKSIPDEYMTRLPSRQSLVSMLGEPTARLDGDTGLHYQYRIADVHEDAVIGEFTVWYESGDAIPSLLISSLKRITTRVDFETRRVSMRYGS